VHVQARCGRARPPEPCGASTASGGQGVTRTRHALGSESGIVRILFQMFGAPDRLDCFHAGVLVATTGDLVSGTGELSFRYDAGPRVPESCLIVVTGPVAGTQWIYTVLCPA